MNIKYDRTFYFKMKSFLSYNSVYIWKVLLKSFPTVCRTVSKMQFIYMPIFLDPPILKTWEEVFLID